MHGNREVAASAIERLRELDPNFRLDSIKSRLPYTDPDVLARWSDGLRKAGLPE
jgi:hypothetical protein